MKIHKWEDIKNKGMSPERIAASDKQIEEEKRTMAYCKDKPTRQTITVSQTWSGPAAYIAGPTQGEFIKGKALDVTFSLGGKTYRVLMAPIHESGPVWEGTYTIQGGPSEDIQGKLYEAADGDMILIGQWFEQGMYTWIVHISPDE